jgi:hypothetical protein
MDDAQRKAVAWVARVRALALGALQPINPQAYFNR